MEVSNGQTLGEPLQTSSLRVQEYITICICLTIYYHMHMSLQNLAHPVVPSISQAAELAKVCVCMINADTDTQQHFHEIIMLLTHLKFVAFVPCAYSVACTHEQNAGAQGSSAAATRCMQTPSSCCICLEQSCKNGLDPWAAPQMFSTHILV